MGNDNNTESFNIGDTFKDGISSGVLRLIACITMFIDHIGYGICEKVLLVTRDPDIFEKVLKIDRVLRVVGRIAFPIFCYQLVVGFFYTRSRKKYALRLLIFSLISEVPFDLMARNEVVAWDYQNVGFTLLLGFLAIWICEIIDERLSKYLKKSTYESVNTVTNTAVKTEVEFDTKEDSVGSIEDDPVFDIKMYLAKFIAVIPFMVLAEYMHTDYASRGVFLIVLIYLFFDDQFRMACVVPSIFLVYYFFSHWAIGKSLDNAIHYTTNEMAIIVSFLLILKDNRKRSKSMWYKVLGYSFYPAHMLLIFTALIFILYKM